MSEHVTITPGNGDHLEEHEKEQSKAAGSIEIEQFKPINAALDHKTEAEDIGQYTDGSNKPLLLFSQSSRPFVHNSGNEAFHGAEL